MYYAELRASVGHTPLVELSSPRPYAGVRLLAKLEGLNSGGSASIKDRIALSMIERAEKDGRLKPGDILLEATSGNTGIALAWAGKMKGYSVTIAMPENMSAERQALIRLFGAELILTPASGGVTESINQAAALAAGEKRYFLTEQFANPANPLTHYETTAVEMLADFPCARMDYFICGIGTGGTITGTGRRLREAFPDIKIIGVEPPPDDAIQGLRCLANYLPPVMDITLLSERIQVTSRQAEQGTLELLNREGIFAGTSSGAVYYAACQLGRRVSGANLVTILPDGGWKYLSMSFWNRSQTVRY